MPATIQPSVFDSIHDSALMLLETASNLVAIAKDPEADVNGAERAFKDFYSNLFAYASEFRNNLKQAVESWIAFNQNQNSPTAFEQVVEFAEQVKHAEAPDPGYLPGHHPGRLSLGSSGPGRKQIERFKENWPFISKNLAEMKLLDKAKLERKLDQELVRARALARLSEGAIATALLSREEMAQLTANQPKPSKYARAIALLVDHPDWTKEQIAKAVPCHVKYLSQNAKFKAARKATKGVGQEDFLRSKRRRGTNMDDYSGEE